jgi:regulator of sigma E protease
MIITILVFLLILSILVLVHEAGHFFTAKFFKIKVEEFGFGLPPRVFGKKFGETIYSLNWLPIGGFVKLYGEDEAGSGSVSNKPQKINPKDKDRAFFAKPAWQRAAVVFAGVFMNFMLAVVIISFLFSVVGIPVPKENVIVTALINGAPAQKAGLVVGDTIEKINGVKITSSTQLVKIAKDQAGEKLILDVKTKDSKTKKLELTPRKEFPKGEGPMGVAISQDITIKKYPWYQAPFVGTLKALNDTWLIASGLGSLVVQLATKGAIPQDVAGPIGIAQLTGAVCTNAYSCMSLVSLLTLNLAIINILPIPALDGGRLFFILFEAITRRKVDPKFEGYAHTIGMVVLLCLIALITLHDLFKVFTGQPIIPIPK